MYDKRINLYSLDRFCYKYFARYIHTVQFRCFRIGTTCHTMTSLLRVNVVLALQKLPKIPKRRCDLVQQLLSLCCIGRSGLFVKLAFMNEVMMCILN